MPYDGSNYSNNAFYTTLEIAIKFKSKITVVTCLFRPSEEESCYISEHTKIAGGQNDTLVEFDNLQKISITKKI